MTPWDWAWLVLAVFAGVLILIVLFFLAMMSIAKHHAKSAASVMQDFVEHDMTPPPAPRSRLNDHWKDRGI